MPRLAAAWTVSLSLLVSLSLSVPACGGPARPAAPSSPTEPAPPPVIGTVAFTVTAAPGRELPAMAWYPAQKPGGVNAPPVTGRKLPVLLMSHGMGGKKEHAAYLAQRVAAEGYLVAAVDHLNDGAEIALQRPVDISKLIDRLGARGGEPAWLADLADLDKIAVYGHSFGGYTALALAGAKVGGNPEWTAFCAGKPGVLGCPAPTPEQLPMTSRRDPRVDLAIGGAPAGYFQFGRAGTAAIETPFLVISAGKDRLTTTVEHVRPLFDHATTPRWFIELADANHFTFVDLCARQDKLPAAFAGEVAEACAPDAPLQLLTAHLLIGDLVLAVLDHTFKGAPAPDLHAIGNAREVTFNADAAR